MDLNGNLNVFGNTTSSSYISLNNATSPNQVVTLGQLNSVENTLNANIYNASSDLALEIEEIVLNSTLVTGNFTAFNLIVNGNSQLGLSPGQTVRTYYNTLDDGSGNATFYGSVTAGSVIVASLTDISNETVNGTLTAEVINTTSLNVLNNATIGGTITAANGTSGNQVVNYNQLTNGSLSPSFSNIAGTLTTANQPNITSVGTLTGLTVNGTITSTSVNTTSITGTLTTASQPNITSVGTLTGLTVNGNLNSNFIGINGNFNGVYTPIGSFGTIGWNITGGQAEIDFVNNFGSYTRGFSFYQYNGTSPVLIASITGSGTLTVNSISGTLITASQPNITSVGTLTGLTVNGNSQLGESSGQTVKTYNNVLDDGSGNATFYGSVTAGSVVVASLTDISNETVNGTLTAEVINTSSLNVVDNATFYGTLVTTNATTENSPVVLGQLSIPNLVLNSNAYLGLNFWNSTGWTVSTTNGYGNSPCFFCSSGNSTTSILSQSIPVANITGESLQLSFIEFSYPGTLSVSITAYNSNGTYLATILSETINNSGSSGVSYITSPIPSGSSYITLQFSVLPSSTNTAINQIMLTTNTVNVPSVYNSQGDISALANQINSLLEQINNLSSQISSINATSLSSSDLTNLSSQISSLTTSLQLLDLYNVYGIETQFTNLTNQYITLTNQISNLTFVDISGGFGGTGTTNQIILDFIFVTPVVFPQNLSGSYGIAITPSSSNTTYNIIANSSSVGTIIFNTGSTSPIFSTVSNTTLNPGQSLQVIGPASPDPKLSNVYITLTGNLNL